MSYIAHGVPQVSILGPLLFSNFRCDLFSIMNKVDFASYADDNKPCNASYADDNTLYVM